MLMSKTIMVDPSEKVTAAAWRRIPILVDMRSGGLWVAGLLMLTGLLFAWQSTELDFGGLPLPGPGFMPLVLGAVLVACAAVIGVERWRDVTVGEPVELGHRDVLVAFAAMLMVPFLFETLGAYLTLGAFGTLLLVVIGRVRIWLAIASLIAGMALCWYFFQILLGLQLPTGPF
jgi:hypothetical protein